MTSASLLGCLLTLPNTAFCVCRVSDLARSAGGGAVVVRGTETNSPYHLQGRLCMFAGKGPSSTGSKPCSGPPAHLSPAVKATRYTQALYLLACIQEITDKKESSIWDWTPPGDLAETGTWKVLRELAGTLSKYAVICCTLDTPLTHPTVNCSVVCGTLDKRDNEVLSMDQACCRCLRRSKDHLPALRRLEVLPTHEIALRLFYLYDHYRRNPVASGFPDAEAQGMLVSA